MQKFASAHASVTNHFDKERHLYARNIFEPAFTGYDRDGINSVIETHGKPDEETGDVRLPTYGLGLPVRTVIPWPANTPTRYIGERMETVMNELTTNVLVRISHKDNRRATYRAANMNPLNMKAPTQ